MKILKQGKKSAPLLEKTFTCDECSAEFRLESEREAKLVSDYRDGDYYEIKCPGCGNVGTYGATFFQRSRAVR